MPLREPVVDLAALYVNAAVQIGIFALRETTARSTLLRRIVLYPNDDVVGWTTIGELDVQLSGTFRLLAARTGEWDETGCEGVPEFVSRVETAFPKPYHLYAIVWRSQTAEKKIRPSRLFNRASPTPLLLASSDEFFPTLERIAYAFRNRRSCAGLFPSIGDLRSHLKTTLDQTLMKNISSLEPSLAEAVRTQYEQKRQRTLVWTVGAEGVDIVVAESKKSQLYLAVRPGFLCELTPHLWRALPVANQVAIREFPVRAKLHRDLDSKRVAIEPLPELGFWTPDTCACTEDERKCAST